MKSSRWIGMACLGLVLAAPAGCGPDYSPNTYASTAVQQANKVEQGVIVGVRKVDVSAQGVVGAATGAAAGGIAGSQVGGGGVATAFGALGGSVLGGLVGTTVEHTTGDTTAYEYVVRKANGDLLSVTQKDEVALPLHKHVLVIAGSQARIVPDYTVPDDMVRDDAGTADKPASEAGRHDSAAASPAVVPPQTGAAGSSVTPVAAVPLIAPQAAPPPADASTAAPPQHVVAPR